MANLLYVIAAILIIGWAVGYFAFHVTGLIHVLPVVALIIFLRRVIRGKRAVTK